MIKGTAVSKGIAIEKALVLKKDVIRLTDRKISENEIEQELAQLETALTKSMEQIEKIQARALRELGPDKAQVFEAHKMLITDPVLRDSIVNKIQTEYIGAADAAFKAIEELKAVFEMMDNEYMRERVADIKDIGDRLIRNILGKERVDLSNLKEDVIIIAEDLTPSDTAAMDKNHVKGFATEIGGETSHTAIIARSLEIPAVVGCAKAIRKIITGDMVIIDGSEGAVFLNPDPATLAKYEEEGRNFQIRKEKLKGLKDFPAITLDGHCVELAGNIAKPEGVIKVLDNGGEAIGLFRTEFLYMNRNTFPSEEEQFAAYKKVAQSMEGKPVIVRTLDIGGDKHLSYLDLSGEMNPFLGYRAIRICLEEVELFKTQLRAILRGSAYGKIKIMFPMISGIGELRKAKAILEEAKLELKQKNMAFDENIEVGIMMEIPSAALTADILAKEADFFSIGTNDLCQYTLAVDRMNEKLSSLYDPLHPAVLRLIKNVIDAGHRQGIMVGVCGEMASGIENSIILLGLGLDEFSMSPSAIPSVKEAIRSITFKKAQAIAKKVMEFDNSGAIKKYVQEELSCL